MPKETKVEPITTYLAKLMNLELFTLELSALFFPRMILGPRLWHSAMVIIAYSAEYIYLYPYLSSEE